jgi:hypothetical protein
MGPVPDGNIFVNDSAYRANLMLKLVSMIQAPSVSQLPGALELNKSSPGDSSFYFDTSLGKTIYVNFSAPGSTAKPTIVPGYDLSFSGAVTIRPFPGDQDASTSGNNQTQQETGNVTATPGSATGTPGPSTGAVATPGSTGDTTKPPAASATATPGFETIACLTCLAGVFLAAAKNSR